MYRVHFFLIALCSFLYFRLYTTLNENTIELLRKLPHGDRDESKCRLQVAVLFFAPFLMAGLNLLKAE